MRLIKRIKTIKKNKKPIKLSHTKSNRKNYSLKDNKKSNKKMNNMNVGWYNAHINKNNVNINTINSKGGGKKKCMCVNFEKKGNAYINYEDGTKCNKDAVNGTDFCENHQDCMGFSKLFVNGEELDYDPKEWNDKPNVKNSHNCYTYFLNSQINPIFTKCSNLIKDAKLDKCSQLKAQPGDFHTLVTEGSLSNKNRVYSCKDMTQKVLNDNPSIEISTFDKKCKPGSYKGALVVDPGNTYHFYRQNKDGSWSHKPGILDVTNVDADGNIIYFPHIANRNYKEKKDNGINYTDFCNYMCVPKKNITKNFAI